MTTPQTALFIHHASFLETQFQPLVPTERIMRHILEWLVYFAKCSNCHIKNESSKDRMGWQSLQEILWEKQQKHKENSQVNGY